MRYCVYNEDKSQVLEESPDSGAEFALKESAPLPALPVALKTMKKGEKASLILKAGCEFSVIMLVLFLLHTGVLQAKVESRQRWKACEPAQC